MKEENQLDTQLLLVQEMIKENNNAITIADAKAGFTIILCSTILGVFFSFLSDILDYLKDKNILFVVFIIIMLIISLVLIFISIIISIFSVIPRFGSLEDGKNPALPYFQYVSKVVESPEKLSEQVKKQSSSDILEILSTQSYELAKIADEKVTLVRYSLLLFLSSLFSLIGLIGLIVFYFRFNMTDQKKNKKKMQAK